MKFPRNRVLGSSAFSESNLPQSQAGPPEIPDSTGTLSTQRVDQTLYGISRSQTGVVDELG